MIPQRMSCAVCIRFFIKIACVCSGDNPVSPTQDGIKQCGKELFFIKTVNYAATCLISENSDIIILFNAFFYAFGYFL